MTTRSSGNATTIIRGRRPQTPPPSGQEPAYREPEVRKRAKAIDRFDRVQQLIINVFTSSGLPSRLMTKANVGKRRDAATGGHAVGGHAAGGDTTGDRCDSCDKPPSHDTSRIAWAKLMARVGEEFPFACPGCGGDIRLIAFITIRGRSGRSWHISANRSNHRPCLPPAGHPPTGASSCRPTTTGQSFRHRPTSCPTSTSTASDRIPCHGADGPREERFQGRSAPTRKIRP